MRLDGWIDVHAHFYPPEGEDERVARWRAMRDACWCTPSPPTKDPGRILAYMDRRGIQLQLLSNVPKDLDALRRSNDYAAELVRRHPTRFGMLAALPTDDPEACLAELHRAADELGTDGFAVTCRCNGVYLSDPSLDPVWAELDQRRATVFAHPDANAPPTLGRPAAVIYAGLFRRYPDVRFVLTHCGGALPALSGRLLTLGLESWVPNPNGITPAETLNWTRYTDDALEPQVARMRRVVIGSGARHPRPSRPARQ